MFNKYHNSCADFVRRVGKMCYLNKTSIKIPVFASTLCRFSLGFLPKIPLLTLLCPTRSRYYSRALTFLRPAFYGSLAGSSYCYPDSRSYGGEMLSRRNPLSVSLRPSSSAEIYIQLLELTRKEYHAVKLNICCSRTSPNAFFESYISLFFAI